MTGFEYNRIDPDDVLSVELISQDSKEYREFLRSIYESDDQSQYEEWAEAYPKIAREYVQLAEQTLKDPTIAAHEIARKLHRPDNPVCGACRHSRDDDYRDGQDKIVCWENTPPDSGRRPRKLTSTSNFAQDCDYFQRSRRALDGTGVHSRLAKPYFIADLFDDDDNDARKAALKYAYYQTWGLSNHVDTQKYMFNPNREEAMLRYFNSKSQDNSNSGVGQGGREFEQKIVSHIENFTDFHMNNLVFKIELPSKTTYKEMDVHLRVGDSSVIAELYTLRQIAEKRKQLQNYVELYQMATDEVPERYLVTDRIVDFVEKDGEMKSVERDTGDSGEITPSVFFDELRDLSDNPHEQTPLTEYTKFE